MSSKLEREQKRKTVRTCFIAVIALAIGCYMLFVLSRSFKPVLGNTFHILVGCILISVSLLVLYVSLKKHFFPKKRKKRSNVVFLEDELKKDREL